jgi:hypothetical protein
MFLNFSKVCFSLKMQPKMRNHAIWQNVILRFPGEASFTQSSTQSQFVAQAILYVMVCHVVKK